MSYSRLTDAEIEAGAFTLSSTATKIQSNQDFFAAQIGTLAAVQLSNGSFEIASDAAQPNLPDNWELNRYPNGVFVLDTTLPRHGAKIAKFTHPSGAGNGGGQLESDYFEISPDVLRYILVLTFWTTNANVRIKIEVEYFTAAQVSISTETLHNQTSAGVCLNGNPTSAERRVFPLTVPATARYMRITDVGGYNDTDPGSSTDIYFDQMWIVQEDISYSNLPYSPGTNIIHSDDALVQTTSETYVQLKGVEVIRRGQINVYFTLQNTGTFGNVFARIYVNGVAVGTERILAVGPTNYSEDITVQPGDTVEIWGKIQFIVTDPIADLTNFRLRNDHYFEETLSF